VFWLAHWTEGEVRKRITKEAKESLALLEEKLRGAEVFRR
jgi:hypothetical protein